MQVFFSNRAEIFKMFAEIAKKDTQTPYKGGQNTNYSVLAPDATCKIQRASTAFTLPSPLTSAAAVWVASNTRAPLAACNTQRASTALILLSPFRSPRRRPLQSGRRVVAPYAHITVCPFRNSKQISRREQNSPNSGPCGGANSPNVTPCGGGKPPPYSIITDGSPNRGITPPYPENAFRA